MPVMVESVVRLVRGVVGQPVATLATLLYYSNLLPRNLSLERLVRHEFMNHHNYFFHVLVIVLRCFW